MHRITRDELGIEMAQLVARRATCLRRSVGCVLTDVDGVILATGYNGVPRGLPHCNEGHPCPAAGAPSGTALDGCRAIHAEQNALIFLTDPNRVHTVYTTTLPCDHCVKMIMNTSAKRIVFAEDYPHGHVRDLWQGELVQLTRP